jgi:hypothetical protein
MTWGRVLRHATPGPTHHEPDPEGPAPEAAAEA